MSLKRIFHININVTNLERSISFYEKLGFKLVRKFRYDGVNAEKTSKAFGVPTCEGSVAYMRASNLPGEPVLDLIEWDNAGGQGKPYKDPTNLGIFRIAMLADNPAEYAKELEEKGIELLGPVSYGVPPGGEQFAAFAFYDPDGTFLEVVSGIDFMAEPE